jgi:hypothetical protein
MEYVPLNAQILQKKIRNYNKLDIPRKLTPLFLAKLTHHS